MIRPCRRDSLAPLAVVLAAQSLSCAQVYRVGQ